MRDRQGSGLDPVRSRGDVAVVYLEADDLAAAFTILGTSAEPFDRWFRDHVRQVHGIALEDKVHPARAGARFRHQQDLTQ